MKTYPFNFYPFEKKKVIEFLYQKAKQGYLLTSVDFQHQSAVFDENHEAYTHYDLSLHDEFESNLMKEEFLESCLLSGWKNICCDSGVYFFVNHEKHAPLTLFDEEMDQYTEERKLNEYKQTNKINGWSLLLPIALAYAAFFDSSKFDFFILLFFPTEIIFQLYITLSKTTKIRKNSFKITRILISSTFLIYLFFSFTIPFFIYLIFALFVITHLFSSDHPALLNILDLTFKICVFSILYFLISYVLMIH